MGRLGLRGGLCAAALSLVAMLAPVSSARADEESPTVVPIAQCSFKDPSTGHYNTVWGYNNTSGQTLQFPVGAANFFYPGSQNLGQPTTFNPGLHTNVFVTAGTASVAWVLNGSFAVTPTSAQCQTNPVPVVGTNLFPVVSVGAMVLATAAFIVVRRRRSAVSGA